MSKEAAASSLPPVVLVHGNGEGGAHWATVVERLRRAGCSQVFAIDLQPPSHGSNVDYAHQLRAFVDGAVTAEVGATTRLAFVAHSLGVTVLRYYLTHLGGAARLDRAVLIAGCNHGVPVCDAMLVADPDGQVFRQAAELRTDGSAFLRDLAEHEDRSRYLTISGPHDHSFALWEESPQLDGADNRVLPGLGHWGLRDSTASFELILAALTGAAASTSAGCEPLVLPTDPAGRWLSGEPDAPLQAMDLRRDGSAELTVGARRLRGHWTATTGERFHLLDVTTDGGDWRGIYRLTVDGDMLGLSVAAGAQRPASLTLAPVYHRAPVAPGRPAALIGSWRAVQQSMLAALGTVDPVLHLLADGEWRLNEGDATVCSGTWQADAAGAAHHHLDLAVEQSRSFMVGRGSWWGALARRDGHQLLVELAEGTYRACRPALFDHPAVFAPA